MVNNQNIINLIYKKIFSNKISLIEKWNNPKDTHTKHIIIDNLLPNKICDDIYKSFPSNISSYYTRRSFRESKKTSANVSFFAQNLCDALFAFQDNKIINLISEITNMENLEADEKLYAGGISVMSKNDFLNPHIDNSHNISRNRYRRLNLLYYVTPDWDISDGGNFELWDNSVKNTKTITPKFNRLIIMETNKTSWHSVSKVEVDKIRCCVSNYYFSKKSPNINFNEYFHVTSFLGRPNEKYKRLFGHADNYLRNAFSVLLKVGRGKNLINKGKK